MAAAEEASVTVVASIRPNAVMRPRVGRLACPHEELRHGNHEAERELQSRTRSSR